MIGELIAKVSALYRPFKATNDGIITTLCITTWKEGNYIDNGHTLHIQLTVVVLVLSVRHWLQNNTCTRTIEHNMLDRRLVCHPRTIFIIKDLPSVFILIIAAQNLNDSLCCSIKYN